MRTVLRLMVIVTGLVLATPAAATLVVEASPAEVTGEPGDLFTLSVLIDDAPATEGLTVRLFFDPTQLIVDGMLVEDLVSVRPADDPGGRIFQIAAVRDVTADAPSPELTVEIRYGASFVGNPGLAGLLLEADFTIAPGASPEGTQIVTEVSIALAGIVGDDLLGAVTTPVPEPSSQSLAWAALLSLCGVFEVRRRRRVVWAAESLAVPVDLTISGP